MKSLSGLLLCIVFVYSASCGLVPSFSSNEVVLKSDNSSTTLATNVSFQPNVTTTTSAEQIIVPKTAIANASDILLSKETNSSRETNEVFTDFVAPVTEENRTTATENEIVVPKEAIDNTTLELAITASSLSSLVSTTSAAANVIVVPKTAIVNSSFINETQSTSGNADTADTVQPNQGLGPISVHKRNANTNSPEYPDTSSAIFEKYDTWNGTGAITSEEKQELYRKGIIRDRRNVDEVKDESDEEDLNGLAVSNESGSSEKITTKDIKSSNTSNATLEVAPRDSPIQLPRSQDEDGLDDDGSICAVDKDDEEATRLVTIFWRSIFCVIFVIIIVYPIYSYTKIYCQKRRKDADSVSTKQFVDSDSEISNTNDSPTPTTTK